MLWGARWVIIFLGGLWNKVYPARSWMQYVNVRVKWYLHFWRSERYWVHANLASIWYPFGIQLISYWYPFGIRWYPVVSSGIHLISNGLHLVSTWSPLGLHLVSTSLSLSRRYCIAFYFGSAIQWNCALLLLYSISIKRLQKDWVGVKRVLI